MRVEYVFNFCNFGQLQFRAGRFPNALPNAKLWPLADIAGQPENKRKVPSFLNQILHFSTQKTS